MNLYDYGGTQISVAPPSAGKTWTLFGDSLTEAWGGADWTQYNGMHYPEGDARRWVGYKFASRIGRELRLTLDNRAKSGSNIYYSDSGTYAAVNGITLLNSFIAEIEAGTFNCPDYVTVAFGSNSLSSAIGASGDTSTDTGTVYGATKYFIEKLRALQANYNPQMVFGFVLPPQTEWSNGVGGHDVAGARAAIKAVLDSDAYSAPYVDMWTESGITPDMMPDGVHISSERTNNLYYHAMRRFMLGL